MNIERLHVSGYRSLRNVRLDLKQLNVIVGENGSGKSNLYRALQLLSTAANGRFARELANEGGIRSVLWGGNRMKTESKRITVEVAFEELNYKLSFGRVAFNAGIPYGLECFRNDPKIKQEEISVNYRGKTNIIMRRQGNMISAKNMDGRTIEYPLGLQGIESVLSGLRDPQKFPELSELREEFLNWRFYHNFRKDFDSPLRQPQRSVITPIMAHDGSDLVAAIATIIHSNNPAKFLVALEDAFPGAQLFIEKKGKSLVILKMTFPGVNKIFDASELSDGTLQYLCLLAALFSERPPSLLAINEPETSLHPGLYESLAHLLVHASHQSQLWITTHSQELADYVLDMTGYSPIELEKVDGETQLKGVRLGEHNSREYLDEDDDEDT